VGLPLVPPSATTTGSAPVLILACSAGAKLPPNSIARAKANAATIPASFLHHFYFANAILITSFCALRLVSQVEMHLVKKIPKYFSSLGIAYLQAIC
jgi:hypothetical protein